MSLPSRDENKEFACMWITKQPSLVTCERRCTPLWHAHTVRREVMFRGDVQTYLSCQPSGPLPVCSDVNRERGGRGVSQDHQRHTTPDSTHTHNMLHTTLPHYWRSSELTQVQSWGTPPWLHLNISQRISNVGPGGLGWWYRALTTTWTQNATKYIQTIRQLATTQCY